MKLDGQLENAQLEEVASSNPSPRPRSRVYSDITDAANPIPRFYESTRWAPFRLRKERLQSVSVDTVLTKIDENVLADATSAAVTITLPDAASMSGESIYIQKLDSTFNAVHVAAGGVDTVDGISTLNLNTYGEWVKLRSNGTGWDTLDWGYFQGKVSFTPTANMSTNTTLTGYWWRVGDRLFVEYLLAFAGAPDSVSLTLTLPAQISASKQLNTSATSGVIAGTGTFWDNSATTHYIVTTLYSSTSAVRVMYDTGLGTLAAFTQAAPVTVATSDKLFVSVRDIPMAWRGFWAI